jgi:hypothetical protein
MRMRRWATALVTVVAMPLAAADQCDEPKPFATINYEQLGSCGSFREDGRLVEPSTYHAFVIFRITTVENRTDGAEAVFVQPTRFYVIGHPDDEADGQYGLGWQRPRPMSVHFVEAGSTQTIDETILVEMNFPGDRDPVGAAINSGPFTLAYNSIPDTQGFMLVKQNPAKVTWKKFDGCFRIELEPGQGAL